MTAFTAPIYPPRVHDNLSKSSKCRVRCVKSTSRQRILSSIPTPSEPCTEPPIYVLSSYEASKLLSLRSHPTSSDGIPVSLNLGLSTQAAYATRDGITLLNTTLSWALLSKMSSRAGAWSVYGDSSALRVCVHGDRAAISLHPVPNAPPTMVVGGFGMHRFAKGADPGSDTAAKLLCARPTGRVLDICTGLGYTAIGAARIPSVRSVLTIECDQGVVDVQRLNPWSNALFTDAKIERCVADATQAVRNLPDAAFHTVIHDPPALALAGDLYAAAFYLQLRRVSVEGATLFHYIGNPRSRESGRLYAGVARRLEEAGFSDVDVAEDAFGVVARAGAGEVGRFRFGIGRTGERKDGRRRRRSVDDGSRKRRGRR